jgi:hypothetical protein
MKIKCNISTFFKFILIFGTVISICACEIKEKPKQSSPPKKLIESTPIEIKKEEIIKPVKDSIAPSDSIYYQRKDTTETLHQIEKKPEKRLYKKLYIFSLYKKPLIS